MRDPMNAADQGSRRSTLTEEHQERRGDLRHREPFDAQDKRPAVQEFVAKYRAKYKKDTPPAYVALGYDSLMLIADGVRRAKSTDRDAVCKALGATKNLEGANGQFSYNGSGDNLIQKPHIFAYGDKGFERIDR